jgi:hypothetical protein
MGSNQGVEVAGGDNASVVWHAEARHRSARASAAEQRDDAMDSADLEREVAHLTDLVEDLERQLALRLEDATQLRSECARLERAWQEREQTIEEDHRRMLAELTRDYERHLFEAVEARDAATAEATRAAKMSRLARLDGLRLAQQLEDERQELDELLIQRTAEAQRRYEAIARELENERDRAARLANERDRAVSELERIAKSGEIPTYDMAAVLAQHDEFVCELLGSHEREIAGLRRDHARTRRQLEKATRRLADIESGARRRAESSSAEAAEVALRWASTFERIESEHFT